MDSLCVGDRIECDGFKGTVRYIGPIENPAKPTDTSTWIGIEWDDEERGKHDGVAYGKRYFQTDDNSASFVRPEKVSSFGVSFVEALSKKYAPDEEIKEEGPDITTGEEMYVLSSGQKIVPVLFVGKNKIQKKQSKLDTLVEVSLRGCGVKSAGPNENDIQETSPNIVHLDLSDTLITTWDEVATITCQLSRLESLQLSKNRLSCLQAPWCSAALSGLQVLVLNHTGIEWSEFELLKPSLPQLREFHLCGNKLSTLDPARLQPQPEPETQVSTPKEEEVPFRFVEGWDRLTVLYIEDNAFTEWREIERLSKLPKLERLVMNQNLLTDIVPKPKDGEPYFPALKALSITHNKLSHLTSVSRLDTFFPNLEELRLLGNPVVDSMESPGIARFHVISRMANLTTLNASEVRGKEREEAEKYYVRTVCLNELQKLHRESVQVHGMAAWDKYVPIPNSPTDTPTFVPSSFLDEHPRLSSLLSKYHDHSLFADVVKRPEEKVGGASAVSAGGAGGVPPPATTRGLVAVTICGGGKIVNRKLPSSLTVQKLKVMCQQLFKIDQTMQKLSLTDEFTPTPEPLDDDLKEIGFYGLRPGSSILVEEVDADSEKKEEAKRRRAHEELMIQQMKEADMKMQRLREQVHEEKTAIKGGSSNR